MISRYKLKIQFMNHKPGTIITFDDEWGEWTINGFTYGYRGSIGEGEIAMLLHCMISYGLTSLLEPLEAKQ